MAADNRWIYAEGLIGRELEVVSSSDPGLVEISGVVVDETRNTIQISRSEGEITISKAGAVFDLNGRKLEGDGLVGRPEERLKRGKRRAPRRQQNAQ